MSAPTAVSVTEAQIELSWAALSAPADGNSPVTAYNVYWDNGGGTTNIALLDSLVTTVAVPGLTGGVTYLFKVRARNRYGAGAFSTELAVLASDRPDPVAIPSVTIGAAETDVVIAWTQPDEHSAAIDAYEVLLRLADGTYAAACDGSASAVVAALSCSVPMATVAATTGLPVDSLIRVRVRAHNSGGWGAYSELNTVGATIETPPAQMAAPVFDIATSTVSQIDLTWTASSGAAAGGSGLTISNYVLEWDEGTGTWATLLTTTSTGATSTGLTGGATYQYRVSAVNKHGAGPASLALSVVAAQAPEAPDAPTTSLETIYARVAWTAPTDNHAAITAYQILVKSSTGDFLEDTGVCDGSDPAVRDAEYCLIPMAALWAAPFSLPQGALVVATVRAQNARGWGDASAANTAGAEVAVVPHQMAPPTRGTGTSDTAIQVDWLALSSPEDGGSTVLGYALYSDDASGQASWVELAGETALYPSTTFTQTAGVAAGATYYFKVKAKNKWGWGPFSEPSSILAAAAPSQVASPTTAIDAATGGVRISWAAPASAGGVPLTEYRIEVQGSDSTWREDSDCDGTQAAVVTARTCLVPMASLVDSGSHALAFDALVAVRVAAANSRGFGPASDPNTSGARIRQVPAQMAAPAEGPATSDSQVEVVWGAVTGTGLPTGNSAILQYELLWDNGEPTRTEFLLVAEVDAAGASPTSYTVVGATEGATYRSMVQAANIYGSGPPSAAADVVASDIPSRMEAVTTTRDGTDIVLTWVAPADNGAALTAYEIVVLDQASGTFVEDTSKCDGSQAGVLSGRTCTWGIAYLRTTYAYAIGDLVQFKARA